MDQVSQNLEQKMEEISYKSSKRGITSNKGPDQETVKYVHPYFLRSTYSSSFIDLILRSDVLQLVNIGHKYQKGA